MTINRVLAVVRRHFCAKGVALWEALEQGSDR
jgi:hypothetical protein